MCVCVCVCVCVLDETARISHCTNTLGNGMTQIIIPPTKGQ